MPGSPERILLRNPHLTGGRSRPPASAGASTSRCPGPARRVPRRDRAGRPRLLVPVPRPAGRRGHRRPVLADDHPVRPRRGHRHRRRACPRRVRGLETRRQGGQGRQRVQPDPVFDAVLRHRHALLIIFAAELGWFPTSGMLTLGRDLRRRSTSSLDFLRHLVLPLATVSLGLIGAYSILMRSSIIETRTEDYVTTARAKGLNERRVVRQHALPERPAADGHDHRHQPRLRRRRRDHRRDRLQLAGPRDADRRGAVRP